MVVATNRQDIDDTDYDGKNEKRWYYRLYSDGDGHWFWEPRTPSPAEVAAPHTFAGFSWEPTILAESEWPPSELSGPYAQRGEAITVAEGWFDANP